jgi:hypothetical protein
VNAALGAGSRGWYLLEPRASARTKLAKFGFAHIRLPLFLLLAILEPVVNLMLGSLALLGVLLALFRRLVGPPHFPFLLMLGISLGFGQALTCYHALLRSLSS